MSITYINGPFTHTDPDFEVIRANRQSLTTKLASRNDIYISSIKSKLASFNQLLHGVDDNFRQLLARAPIDLQTQELSALVGRMRNSNDSQAQDVADAIDAVYQDEVSLIIKQALDSIGDQVRGLCEQLDGMRAWTLGDLGPFIIGHDHQAQVLEHEVEQYTRKQAELEAAKRDLNAAMKVLEDKTIFDEWLPILQAAGRIDWSKPMLAAIQAGIAGASNILRIASESLKYTDLVEARKRVQTSLDANQALIASRKKQSEALARRNRQLLDIQDIETFKDAYEQEIRKVPTALQTFMSLRERLSTEAIADCARAFIVQADALSTWLKGLSGNWK